MANTQRNNNINPGADSPSSMLHEKLPNYSFSSGIHTAEAADQTNDNSWSRETILGTSSPDPAQQDWNAVLELPIDDYEDRGIEHLDAVLPPQEREILNS